MVASDSFTEFLRGQLAPLGHVTTRRMFGKTDVFCDGVMLKGEALGSLAIAVVNYHSRWPSPDG